MNLNRLDRYVGKLKETILGEAELDEKAVQKLMKKAITDEFVRLIGKKPSEVPDRPVDLEMMQQGISERAYAHLDLKGGAAITVDASWYLKTGDLGDPGVTVSWDKLSKTAASKAQAILDGLGVKLPEPIKVGKEFVLSTQNMRSRYGYKGAEKFVAEIVKPLM